MINKKISTKTYILQRLREQATTFISGTRLGKELDISRVAVWKAMKSLMAMGYPIEESDKGYRISDTEQEDFLYPWEFGEKESLFRYWESTDSTMNRARELADRGISGGTVVLAETQSAGRGRNGKPWLSRRGGLFFTLLERPDLAVLDYPAMTMIAHIAVARALSRICGKKTLICWPNDIYVAGKKIAGILTELQGEGDKLSWISLGMGVNINNNPALPDTVNCTDLVKHPVSRRMVLVTILDEFEKTKRILADPAELCTQWNQEAEGIGRRVLVHDSKYAVERQYSPQKYNTLCGDVTVGKGVFLGIDPLGQGLVKTSKSIIRLIPGSMSLVFI
jgi:BirA family biotin operon repressor/biotin-[acetyl-CoA-carboxylase] ligase